MTGEAPPGPEPRPDPAAGRAAALREQGRRRRRAAVFGEVLPEDTADDREPRGNEPDNDEWLRSNVPPHHG